MSATTTKYPGIECSTRPSLRTVIFAPVKVNKKTQEVGATIRQLREAKGITQGQLATLSE